MRHYRTNSDAGAVRVGTDTFTVNIPNGYGDGITEVYILEPDDKIPPRAEYQMVIKGRFNIMSDDCGAFDPVTTLEGRFGIFSNEGEVYFQRWN